MIRWWTDRPEASTGWLPPGATWTRGDPAGDDALIWSVVGGGAPAFRCEQADLEGTAFPQRRWVIIDSAPASQFDALVEALKRGVALPDGLICLALSGRNFHGQRSRPWVAERGNLHLTAHYRLIGSAAALQAGLTMAPAVAAAQAIRAVSDGRLDPRIKWVNDVLLDGRKVAGVITSTGIESDALRHVVFGIGLNIDRAPVFALEAAATPPGALADVDPSLRGALPRVAQAVVRALDASVARLRAGDVSALYEAYRERAGFLGRRVSIWPESPDAAHAGAPIARGRVAELNPDLSLHLEEPSARVTSGRMVLEDHLIG